MDDLPSKGKLEVILGPAFSGKTSELIRRVQRYFFAGYKCLIICHSSDERFKRDSLITHDGYKLNALMASTLLSIQGLAAEFDVIGIDEAQHFTDVVEFCSNASDNGKKVIVAALDSNYERKAYQHVLSLIPLAEEVNKLASVCMLCFDEAPFTTKTSRTSGEALISVCQDCFPLQSPVK